MINPVLLNFMVRVSRSSILFVVMIIYPVPFNGKDMIIIRRNDPVNENYTLASHTLNVKIPQI